MKKIVSLLLVLAMCAALFAGCTSTGDNSETTTAPTETTTAVNDTAALDAAKSYVYNMYKEDDGSKTTKDYSVVSVVSIGDTTYDIQWAVEVSTGDATCVELSDDGTMATVTIVNSKPTEEVQYKLVGTIADDAGNSVTVTFSHYIGAVEPDGSLSVATEVKEVAAGVAYKWGMYQENLDQTLYFSGTTANKDYYLSTTEDVALATDVYLEEVEGGYHMYFNDAEGNKMYIDMYKSDSGYFNIRLTTEPTAVLVWNTEYYTLVATIEDAEYYIGTYSEYNTLSCSSISYAGSSFCSTMYTVEAKDVTANIVAEPAVDTAYKWGMEQENLEQTLYFAGTTANKDYYLSTTDDASLATDVYLEAVDGGYHMYFNDAEGNKMYIDMFKSDSGYFNIRLTTEPTAVLVWNTEYNTLVATIEDAEYYIGTYSEYSTLSCSSISYIASSFPSHLITIEVAE